MTHKFNMNIALSDDFNILESNSIEIQERMNTAHNDWRITVDWIEAVDIIIINPSYSTCDNIIKVCEILNITHNESKCITQCDFKYFINVAILKKIRNGQTYRIKYKGDVLNHSECKIFLDNLINENNQYKKQIESIKKNIKQVRYCENIICKDIILETIDKIVNG